MANDEEDFEDQLQQEKLVKVEEEESEAVNQGLTYTDTDGTVMEWDPLKKAYFPKIDEDFIARYQMSYGTDAKQTDSTNTNTAAQGSTGSHTTAAGADNAWQDYYNYYNQTAAADSTSADQSSSEDGAKDGGDQQQYTNAEWYSYYAYYYGEDYAKKWLNAKEEQDEEEAEAFAGAKKAHGQEKDAGETGTEDNKKDNEKNKKKGKEKGAEKRKAPEEPPAWFEVEAGKSCHVYVSNLPSELTDAEFQELMAKCGLIMFDPLTHKPKLKLYRNPDGSLKGDGLCCYIKQESVQLALNILDGSNVMGKIIKVERAKFELKGNFDPSKKKKKLSNKAKRKMKERQEKLFDWRPDKPPETRLRYERNVVLKNMFDVKEFEDEPTLINELREDVRSECSKFGEVRKIQVHDRHPEGVITVMFRTPEEGDVCVAALNGRWFAKRQIIAQTYDGKTKYAVSETDAEKEERLRGWETFLESDTSKTKTDSSVRDEASKGKTDSGSSSSGVRGQSMAVQGEANPSSSASVADSTPVNSEVSGASQHLNADSRTHISPERPSAESEAGAAN